MKASFFKRVAAYIIDILLVTIALSVITMVVSTPDKVDLYEEEIETSTRELLEGDITMDTYISRTYDLTYDLDYAMVGHNILSAFIYILYFIFYQFYNKGKTIGKKIMNIKIVKVKGELTINDIALRSVLINGILINMISMIVVLVASRSVYITMSSIINMIHTTFIILGGLLILLSKEKRAIHDILARTKVIIDGN